MRNRGTERPRLLVIGGDAAGMSAASRARRGMGPEELEIVALESGNHTSYSACGIPYLVGGTVPRADDLIARDPRTFIEEYAIDVRTRTRATAIDTGRRVVSVQGPSGAPYEERYDRLLIATGAVPLRPDLPGAHAEGIFGVQTLDEGEAVRSFLAEEHPQRAVVVGGGYIGLEMAEAFLERGLEVDLVEAADEPMGTLDPDMGALVREAMSGMGIGFWPRAAVTEFETADGRVTGVVTERGTFAADIVVLGLGTRPNSDLAAAAGIDVGPSGGIVVDRRMRTSTPGVWAAGDCVENFHRVSCAPVAIALGTHANKHGRVAGSDIVGDYAWFPGVVGTAVTKICGVEVARSGLNEREAADAGFATVTVTVDSTTRAGYFPGAGPITVKLIAERRTGRLLGGQIVGREDAAKRVDVIATALWNSMTVEEVAGLDLGYAPPFSPVWDPVLIAARKLGETARG